MFILIRIASLVTKLVSIYSTLLVIYALLSWFPGAYDSKLGKILTRICEPYLSLFYNLRLSIGPIDFTIIVAIVLLEMANKGLWIIVSLLLGL